MLGEGLLFALLIVEQIAPTRLGTSSVSLTPTEKFPRNSIDAFLSNIAARIVAKNAAKMLQKMLKIGFCTSFMALRGW